MTVFLTLAIPAVALAAFGWAVALFLPASPKGKPPAGGSGPA